MKINLYLNQNPSDTYSLGARMDISTFSENMPVIFYTIYHTPLRYYERVAFLKEIVSFKAFIVTQTANCLFWLSFDCSVSTLNDFFTKPAYTCWIPLYQGPCGGLGIESSSSEGSFSVAVGRLTTQCAKCYNRGLYKGLWETNSRWASHGKAFQMRWCWNSQKSEQKEDRHGKGEKIKCD